MAKQTELAAHPLRSASTDGINVAYPSPEAVLAAAERAPRAFDMAAYHPAIRIMREKGNSWRDLAIWLRRFEIEISYVHLRRLYIQENARIARLGTGPAQEQGRALGAVVPVAQSEGRPAVVPGSGDSDADDEAKWTRL
jgi:hypothetical protein